MEPQEIGLFDAKTKLSELVRKVEAGQSFSITRRGRRVALLVPPPKERLPLARGCARNDEYWMAPDFDDTPDDFAEYVR